MYRYQVQVPRHSREILFDTFCTLFTSFFRKKVPGCSYFVAVPVLCTWYTIPVNRCTTTSTWYCIGISNTGVSLLEVTPKFQVLSVAFDVGFAYQEFLSRRKNLNTVIFYFREKKYQLLKRRKRQQHEQQHHQQQHQQQKEQ
jgi:hypothetical protein